MSTLILRQPFTFPTREGVIEQLRKLLGPMFMAGEGDGDGGDGDGSGAGGLADLASGGDGDGSGDGDGGDGEGGDGDGDGGGDDGQAEKPEFLQDKYWDPEANAPRLEEMANGIKGLETKLREKHPEAPESAEVYEFTVPDDAANFKLDDDNEADKALMDWWRATAFEAGLSKENAEKIFGGFAKLTSDMIMPEPFDGKAELEKLGPNGQAVVDSLVNQANQLKAYGVFNDTDIQEFKIAMGTADGSRMMSKLLTHLGVSEIPDAGITPQTPGGVSKQELDELRFAVVEEGPNKGKMRYNVDPDYRERIDGMYDKMYGNQPAGTSETRRAG